MRQLLSFALLFFLFSTNSASFGQLDGWQNKVSWKFTIEKIDDSHAYIVGTAKLIPGWHIFSVNHDPNKADLTGYPTTFTFQPNANYKLIGKLIDGKKAIVHKDELGTSLYFEKEGVFKQKIEILTDKAFDVQFEYAFQICDENGCLFPPDQEGKIKIEGFKPKPENMPLTIKGDFATDSDNNNYVKFNGKWVMVPAENSPKFYKKYLELGGTNEDN